MSDFPPPPRGLNPPSVADEQVVDEFGIGVPRVPVDVLVAIDPDPELHAELEASLPALLASLNGFDSDWRVAFTSTALGDAEAVGYLAPTGADGDRWLTLEDIDDPVVDWSDPFPDAEPLGASGATLAAIEQNPTFHRPDALLHLVILSPGPDDTPPELITFDAWRDWVAAEAAVVSALEADGDFSTFLHDVGLIGSGVPARYYLSAIPVPWTIELTVGDQGGDWFVFFEAVGVPPVGDWTYDQATNAVAFLEYVPGEQATVRLTYVSLATIE